MFRDEVFSVPSRILNEFIFLDLYILHIVFLLLFLFAQIKIKI